MRDLMSRGRRPRTIFATAIAVVAASVGIGARVRTPAVATPAVTARQPAAPTGWPAPGQNLDNSRAAVGSRITRANVDSLKVAFTAEPSGLGTLSTAPLVVD